MKIFYEPIAFFRSSHKEAYEAPRQGVLAKEADGWFELNDKFNTDALEDLNGFERIWLIYDFHNNKGWKPKVRPPRFSENKRSIFSTRSPYRPNNIGMSCVKLEKIEGKRVFVSEHDLLEGSPILDIKPYLPYADSFSGVKTGWVKKEEAGLVEFTEEALEKVMRLEKMIEADLIQILSNQLAFEPTNSKAKRVKKRSDHFVFAVKTWRFSFRLLDSGVKIFDVFSGYSKEEMDSTQDPHGDKKHHRSFTSKFNN